MEKPRYDVFLSHATADKPVVEELARRLKKAGFEPWLDKWNLIPGDPWQEAIEQALEECATCAVCLGPSGTGPWQNEEMRAAIDARVSDRSRHFRVIPVLLPHSERGEPSRLPAFLRATTWVEFRETLDDENALHRLASGIRGVPPGADPGEAVAEGACPYRGLQVFDVGDSLFFFGREALTEWLLDKLRTDRTGNRFLAIVGPSGSGKSSLARAGLVASLKQGKIPGSDTWQAVICKPGAQPLESLAVALSGAARLGDSPSAVRDLIRDLGADPRMLHLTTRLSLRDAPADRRLVVLVDQFEEVFTLCSDEPQRQAIIANLLYAATAADGQTVVVLTLRADFYGRCAAYPDLATAVADRQSLVGPMTRDELRSAIERPAYLAGCELEGGLTDLLLNEVESQPGSLPLLEHALLQIWQRREGGRRLTVAAYREIGGVAGALEKHAEEVYSGFTEEEKEICRRVFLRLVQVDEQGRATKRRLGLEELPGEGVVSRLTDARLLTTDREKESPTVEVAHEALLVHWERLRHWIEQDREALRARRRLDEAVAEWLGRDQDSSFLLVRGRLTEVEDWAKDHSEEVTPDRGAFLAASIAARDRERRRQKMLTLTFGVIAAVAVIAAITALYLQHIAERQKRLALAGELSERARSAFATDPQLGLLLATQALKIARDAGEPHLPNAQSALRWALARSGGTPLSSGRVAKMFLTHDGTTLITYGMDLHLRRWNLRDGDERLPLDSQDLGKLPIDTVIYRLAASPMGQWLLLAGQQGSQLLNLGDRATALSHAKFFKDEDWPEGSEPFSANGRWLALRRGKSLVIRDLRYPDMPELLVTRKGTLSAQFGSDSVAMALDDGSIEVRNLISEDSRTYSKEFPPDMRFRHLAFQADGTLIATADRVTAGTPFWAVRPGGALLGPNLLQGCYDVYAIVPAVAYTSVLCKSDVLSTGIWKTVAGGDSNKVADWPFVVKNITASLDGRRLAFADAEGNVYLRESAEQTGPPLKLFTTSAPESVFFSRGGRWLITFAPPEAPRFWDLYKGLAIADFEPRIVRIPGGSIPVLTARGEYLRRDQSLGQLRFSTLNNVFVTKGLPGVCIFNLFPNAISADSRWLAGVRVDGNTLSLWEIKPDGSVGLPVPLAKGNVATITFSHSGTWLAAGLDGKTVLWKLNDIKAKPLTLATDAEPVTSVAFSPGEEFVASSGTSIHVWPTRTEGLRTTREFTASAVAAPRTLAFSKDGRWLAIAGGGDKIQLWQPHGQETFLENRGGEVRLLVFSPDGRWLAAGCEDGTIQLWRWNAEDTNPAPILLQGHLRSIASIVFTAGGLLSMDSGNTIRRWELGTSKLLALACESAGRPLTEQEWEYYAGSNEPYPKDKICPGPIDPY